MTDDTPKPKPPRMKPISMFPLSLDDALRGAMKVPPPPAVEPAPAPAAPAKKVVRKKKGKK